jgi:hypothetical protein
MPGDAASRGATGRCVLDASYAYPGERLCVMPFACCFYDSLKRTVPWYIDRKRATAGARPKRRSNAGVQFDRSAQYGVNYIAGSTIVGDIRQLI